MQTRAAGNPGPQTPAFLVPKMMVRSDSNSGFAGPPSVGPSAKPRVALELMATPSLPTCTPQVPCFCPARPGPSLSPSLCSRSVELQIHRSSLPWRSFLIIFLPVGLRELVQPGVTQALAGCSLQESSVHGPYGGSVTSWKLRGWERMITLWVGFSES